ncbi:MAG: hypothetical protein LUG52_05995 [Clostridia bacterium]|nr:hypothetical protein [Clostridia bacterium]
MTPSTVFSFEINVTVGCACAVIAALYDAAGEMLGFSSFEAEFLNGEAETFEGTIASSGGAVLKAFIWDDLETMTPKCAAESAVVKK